MSIESLKSDLCKHFCADILIKETSEGLVISSGIVPDFGDRIAFTINEVGSSHFLVDDGDFLSSLDASGMDLLADGRRQFLDGTLSSSGAFWDRSTFVIRTELREGPPTPAELIGFLTSLIRVRDIRFWTREVIRSTFKDDAIAAIRERFSTVANIDVAKPVDDSFPEFPADVVLHPLHTETATAVYLVNSNDDLGEALALWQEARSLGREDIKVFAILEDEKNDNLNKRKIQRTSNRIDAVAFFRGDEHAVIERVGRIAGLDKALPRWA